MKINKTRSKFIKVNAICIIVLALLLSYNTKCQLILDPNTNGNNAKSEIYLCSDILKGATTQKILHYRENTTVALSHVNGHPRFYFFEALADEVNPNIDINYVDLPSYFTVVDFDLMGDSIYFCGTKGTEQSPVPKANYIAYAPTEDFIFGGTEPTFTNLSVEVYDGDTIYNLRKIKVYKDSTNTRIIAGIGSMYQGQGLYGIQNDITHFPKNKYEYLMFYKITENEESLANYYDHVNPPNGIVNHVHMYRNPQCPNDTMTRDYLEKFDDITLTDDYVVVASSIYRESDSAWAVNYGYGPINQIILRAFDKNDYSQIYGALTLSNMDYSPTNPIKIEHLLNNQIALAYVRLSPPPFPKCSDVVINKINIFSTGFSIVHTSKIDDNDAYKHMLQDITYFPPTNKLYVLKNVASLQSSPNYAVYPIDMNPNTSFPYTISALYVPDSNGLYHNWQSLDYIDNNHFAVIGNFRGKACFWDGNIIDNNLNCTNQHTTQVSALTGLNFSSFYPLEACTFGCTYYYGIDGFLYHLSIGTDHFNVIVDSSYVDDYSYESVTNTCSSN